MRLQSMPEIGLYASSLTLDQYDDDGVLQINRDHWSAIENGTHYRHDVTLGEDAARRIGNEPPCWRVCATSRLGTTSRSVNGNVQPSMRSIPGVSNKRSQPFDRSCSGRTPVAGQTGLARSARLALLRTGMKS